MSKKLYYRDDIIGNPHQKGAYWEVCLTDHEIH